MQSLKSHPQSIHAAWDLFPTGILVLYKSGCWSKPNLVMYSLLFLFSFNVSILKVS